MVRNLTMCETVSLVKLREAATKNKNKNIILQIRGEGKFFFQKDKTVNEACQNLFTNGEV